MPIYIKPIVVNQTPFVDYTLRDGQLFKLNWLCVSIGSTCLTLIREVQHSCYGGYFWHIEDFTTFTKIFLLAFYAKTCGRFIRRCSSFSQSKPSNRKLVLHQPLLVPSQPWESISMDLISRFHTMVRKHACIFVVLYWFYKMDLYHTQQNYGVASKTIELSFQHVWCHLGLQLTIIFYRDQFSQSLLENLVKAFGLLVEVLSIFPPHRTSN